MIGRTSRERHRKIVKTCDSLRHRSFVQITFQLSSNMLVSTSIILSIVSLASLPSTHAIADCDAFNSACVNACQSQMGLPSNSTCSDFAASCRCLNAYSVLQTPTPDVISKANSFCSSIRDECSKSVCSNGAIMDSNYCDTYTLGGQCSCRSESSQMGGPLMGKNESACAVILKKCSKNCGGDALENTCSSPKKHSCKCAMTGEANMPTAVSAAAALFSAALFLLV